MTFTPAIALDYSAYNDLKFFSLTSGLLTNLTGSPDYPDAHPGRLCSPTSRPPCSTSRPA